MKYRKLRKLIRNPRLYFEDALKKRFNKFIQENQGQFSADRDRKPAGVAVSALPKINEHLVACSLLGPNRTMCSGTRDSRVYILTSVPFWRERLGNQCRIAALARYLREHFDLTVIFAGTISIYDAKEISATGWAGCFKALIDVDTAFAYEFDYRNESLAGREQYNGSRILDVLLSQYPCRAIIVEYITHEPFVRYLNGDCLRIIDTHDVMNVRMEAFARHGRDHHINISEAEELHWLDGFDKIIAIQSEEEAYLKARLDPDKVILAHHAIQPIDCLKHRAPKRLVYLAGRNPANLDSIDWFFDKVWPRIAPTGVEMHLYGAICELMPKALGHNQSGIFLHGEVRDQLEVYRAGDIVVNPVLYGGGLKIKTVEGMAHGLPMVTTSEGARGLQDLAGHAFLVADDEAAFAEALLSLVDDGGLRERLSRASLEYVEQHFSYESCFGAVRAAIERFEPGRKSDVSRIDECGDSDEVVLIIGRRDFPLFMGSQQALRKFRNAMFIPASEIKDAEAFRGILRDRCIDRVLINNPYINSKLLSFYRLASTLNIPVTTFDRGALPYSWFFDPRGFNGDSESYDPVLWDRPLSEAERDGAAQYIKKLISQGDALEKQGTALGASTLRTRLGVGNRKLLFVPFQRPNDTVVKYFSKNVAGMDGFVEFVDTVVASLPSNEWLVVGKRHPLEVQAKFGSISMVDPDTNINDLLDAADAVLALNSGVGLLSLIRGKPTYVCGQAFYAHEGLAVEVVTPKQLVEKLASPAVPSGDTILRFVHYLVEEFYSFGRARGYLRKEKDGQLSPITTGIDFWQIRGIGEGRVPNPKSCLPEGDSVNREAMQGRATS